MQSTPPAARRRIHPSQLLLAPVFVFGCAVDTIGPPTVPLHARFDAVASGTEFPNVVRFQDQFAISIQDPETNLVAVAGLPDDPTQSALCGGDEPFAIVDYQVAGIRDGVIQAMGQGATVNLHVYRRSTFVNPCVSTPIAEGTGRLMYVDNDVLLTGDGGSTWGWVVQGSVTLVGGGSAHLLAHNRFQMLPDGTVRRVFRQVLLN